MDFERFRNLDWDQPQRWGLWLRVLSLVFAAVLSFLCTWRLGSSGGELELAARQAASLELVREKARLARSELEAVQNRARALAAQIGTLRGGFLLADELPELLDLLANLCTDRGVMIEALVVEDHQGKSLLAMQSVGVLLAGTYHQLGLLHEDLANLPWPVVAQEFEIQADEEASEVLELRLTLLVPVDSDPTRSGDLRLGTT